MNMNMSRRDGEKQLLLIVAILTYLVISPAVVANQATVGIHSSETKVPDPPSSTSCKKGGTT